MSRFSPNADDRPEVPNSDVLLAVVVAWAAVAKTVFDAGGPTRLRLDEAGLVIEDRESRIPVIILAPHRREVPGVLVADGEGSPLKGDGDSVQLVGGFAPDGDPPSPAFRQERSSCSTGSTNP